jgi:hypothetical protein
MIEQQISSEVLRTLSDAVERWFEFYEVESDEKVSRTLCDAAVVLYRRGHRKVDDIATILIGTYIGLWSARVNAPTSASMH